MLVGYLVFTTVLGARLAGKQATIRDFFLGGRKLPWYAVSGSIVATEISAVTFVSVPAIVFAAGGNLTYLQLMFGAVIARVIIGLWFVPAFYEREIYSPYDYIGQRLGNPARTATTCLFLLGGVLAQSARVLLTAVILEEITGLPLSASIWVIGAVAVGWTLLGGISIVIWTDLIQFVLFVAALLAALVFVIAEVPGGWGAIFELAGRATDAAGRPASKLVLWNLSTDPRVAFTLWAGLIGNTLMCLNAYGTDQMVAQRMFCCRGPRPAALAIIASSVGLLVAALAMVVGLALYAFYEFYPLGPDAAARVADKVDRILPIFIVAQMPPGLTGLIIAGIFAAAISSLDSILAALSQTVVSGLYRPWRERRRGGAGEPAGGERSAAGEIEEDPHYVRASRGLVVAWGVVLCLMAHLAELARQHYGDILNLALAMASYTGGATLAAMLMALLRWPVDYRGVVWGAPLSVLMVLAVSWHAAWAQVLTIAGAVVIVGMWLTYGQPDVGRRRPGATATVVLAAGLAVAVCMARVPLGGEWVPLTVAWPWNVPIGLVVGLVVGWFVGHVSESERRAFVVRAEPDLGEARESSSRGVS